MDQATAGSSEQNLRSFFTTSPSRSSLGRHHHSLVSAGNLMVSEPDHPSLSRHASPQHFLSHHSTTPLGTRRMIPRNELEISRPILARAEKDGDDPTASGSRRRAPDPGQPSTPATISRLFTSQSSPPSSRMSSFIRPGSAGAHADSRSNIASLPTHLYVRGLLDGRYSDLKLIVLGKEYAVHRLVLDQAPFFASALSEPWLEANAKEVTLHPEEIDSNITSVAFELALKRLYGCPDATQEARVALSTFATGCWLEMQDLVDASIDALLQRMRPKNLPTIINMVTVNYYGKGGSRILTACKSLLSRDGLQMPMRYWDNIPSEVIRDVVSGDSFFVQGEWERFLFARRLIDRRLKNLATQFGLWTTERRPVAPALFRASTQRSRFPAESIANRDSSQDEYPEWEALYEHSEILPLFELVDHGIHYIHLDFEQLQFIRSVRDVFGIPIAPEKIINDALWAGLELRQKIINANEHDEGLGLTQTARTKTPTSPVGIQAESYNQTVCLQVEQAEKNPSDLRISSPSAENKAEEDIGETYDFDTMNSFSKYSQSRFWIPSVDRNIVTGGTEPIITLSNTVTDKSAWPSKSRQGRVNDEGRPNSYTSYPPYRFAAEFPNPRFSKDEKRTYSKTIFYAGSLWNIYIQKKRSGSRSPHLGVYLHRAKERTAENDFRSGSVDDRIGALERDMMFRSDPYARYRSGGNTLDFDDGIFTTGGEAELTSSSHLPGLSHPSPIYTSTGSKKQSSKRKADLPIDDSSPVPEFASDETSNSGYTSDEDNSTQPHLDTVSPLRKSALPPYYDNRHTIKTYFKIYSPSKGGRMLSVYESAPDCFDFSQSWGWKISDLMREDEFSDDMDLDPGQLDPADARDFAHYAQPQELYHRKPEGKTPHSNPAGMLRFMVVLGVV